jgi:hypothetical protein
MAASLFVIRCSLSHYNIVNNVVNVEEFKHILPIRFSHVNVYRKYKINLENARQMDGLHALQRPDEQ